MSLRLYFHPLSSFCQKVLIALYETGTPFEPHVVDLMDPAASAAFKQVWPIGRFPVLRDEAAARTIPESSIIIEYIAQRTPGCTLVPAEPEAAREVRLRDRFFDLYVNVPMQKIVTDKLRPPGRNDAHGVEEARALLATALGILEREMADRTWAAGETFTMADCAAAPTLFYAGHVMPFGTTHPRAAAYLARLRDRPSYARALREAKPYFDLFPG
ncbi:MAG TPA: glutathione S-transferase family protein [Xanthobacteraceae bacterium]|nr:glutathione S-transferase family protein [Xanthobacteraceae bacterium]